MLGKSPGNRDPRVLETLWLVQVPGADLFVSTISYVTGAEREQGASGSH